MLVNMCFCREKLLGMYVCRKKVHFEYYECKIALFKIFYLCIQIIDNFLLVFQLLNSTGMEASWFVVCWQYMNFHMARHVNTAHVKSRNDPRKSRKSQVTNLKNPYTKGERIFFNKTMLYLRIYSCSSVLKWRYITFLWHNGELKI